MTAVQPPGIKIQFKAQHGRESERERERGCPVTTDTVNQVKPVCLLTPMASKKGTSVAQIVIQCNYVSNYVSTYT